MAVLGITVRPGGKHKGDPVSRQAFWTRPMVAFVAYLHPLLGSWNATYAAVARLFHLAFGFPNNLKLVERRVLSFRQHHR